MALKKQQRRPAPWWANGLLLLIPVAFFVLLEAGLRLGGYGASYPLFVEAPGRSDYLYQSRDVARRYFSRTATVPTSLTDYFEKTKKPGTLRVFVQGGSTAAGFPYYMGASFSRMLEGRLAETLPDRNVEVVNTAMAAVNSYTLLDLADEIIAQQPDAVLIYAGHNEYYGALGVGATESLGRSPALVNLYLRLRDYRTVQLLRSMLARVGGWLGGQQAGKAPGGTLMARMVGEQSIPYGSDTYRAGLAQFRGNLSALLQKYQQAGVPVFIGTLASNLRDHAPFVSGLAEGTDTSAWRQDYRAALGRAATGDTPGALAQLETLIARDSLSAAAFYQQGRLLDGLGRWDEARHAYAAARDRDQLRFRAPEAFNVTIREVAARYGATIVETEARLADASPHGIVGKSLMLEHLHPNLEGYFLLSDAFYDALHRSLFAGSASVPPEKARALSTATPLDSLLGSYRVQTLLHSWPFQPPGVVVPDTFGTSTPAERLAVDVLNGDKTWAEATEALYQAFVAQGDGESALRAARALAQEFPFEPGPLVQAANVYLQQGRLGEALAHFRQAETRAPDGETQRLIGSILLQQGDVNGAIGWLEKAVASSPEGRAARYNLSGAYALAGRYAEARQAAQALLQRFPGDAPTQALLAQLPGRDE